jgi:hypothetical protein
VNRKNGCIELGIIIRDYEGVVLAVRRACSTTRNFLVELKIW